MSTGSNRSKVFLSFAGVDRHMAERLAEDLWSHGVEVFYDKRDIRLGDSVVLSINNALAESEYCVLLWSKNCVGRPWVEEEWAAAYTRDVLARRSFLFIVRLDETPLPPLLAVRRYLDGFRDWSAVARELVACWRDDRDAGTQVFTAPHQTLGMTHVMGVLSASAGRDLLSVVRATLALPDSGTQLNGSLELRFSYALPHDGELVTDKRVAVQGITDGTILDLEVRVHVRGPDGPIGERIYRGVEGAPEESIRVLVETAFTHFLR